MESQNTNQNPLLMKFRLAELEAKKHARHYLYLYRKECVKSRQLQKDKVKLKKQLEKSERKCDRLINRFCPVTTGNDNEGVEKTKFTWKRKSFSQAKCDRTKRQRVSEYKDILFTTINEKIPLCKRAQLTLWLDGKTVNYSWKSKDFKHAGTGQIQPVNFQPRFDHSYASSKLIDYGSDDDDDLSDIDYSSIFHSEGNWQQKHKRSIIHVMDSYRISHEAYHELRHAGKGHFPPLYQIHLEKIVMSGEIPYIKHPTVRTSVYMLQSVFS